MIVARLESQNSNQLSSGWSDPITVNLPSRDQLPPSIIGFNLTDLRFDRASIEWNYENNIDYYLNILESSSGKLKNENVKISESPYRIHGLECLSKYSIQLYGKNKFGLGEIFQTNFTTESNVPRSVFNHLNGSCPKWTAMGQSGRSMTFKLNGPIESKWTVIFPTGQCKGLKDEGL